MPARHDDAGAERQRVGSGMGARQDLTRHRQHGGIAEVEQEDRDEKDDQVAIGQQLAQADRRRLCRSALGCCAPPRQPMIDVARADAENGSHHPGGEGA
jgi:hypothetical protein